MKDLFLKKLVTLYLCKLKDPLFKLTESFKKEQSLLDEYTLEINKFYKSMEKK
jgi:hypothetical protein